MKTAITAICITCSTIFQTTPIRRCGRIWLSGRPALVMKLAHRRSRTCCRVADSRIDLRSIRPLRNVSRSSHWQLETSKHRPITPLRRMPQASSLVSRVRGPTQSIRCTRWPLGLELVASIPRESSVETIRTCPSVKRPSACSTNSSRRTVTGIEAHSMLNSVWPSEYRSRKRWERPRTRSSVALIVVPIKWTQESSKPLASSLSDSLIFQTTIWVFRFKSSLKQSLTVYWHE